MLRLFLCLLFCPFVAQAVTARVLIDENSTEQNVQGSFQVECFTSFESGKNICAKPAKKQREGAWQIKAHNQILELIQSQKIEKLKGRYFVLKGEIWLHDKKIERLDILLEKKKVEWVIHLSIDQYLYGVMASEVPLSWPLSALKAQAVASRTYFLHKRSQSQTHYDVRSDIMDQVYNLKAERHKAIIQAVNETHGMVLVDKGNGKIFPTYFHSDCGGHTSPEGKVWRQPASFNKPVKDPYCGSSSKNNWSFSVDKQKLLSLLHQSFFIPKGVELLSIFPHVQGEKRAYFVDFLFSDNILKRMNANEFRKILGFGKLKSTNFSVENSWGKYVFTGRGFGHGVGMCQWGAQRWARKGKTFQFILEHYYPQAELKKLDSESLHSLQAQVAF